MLNILPFLDFKLQNLINEVDLLWNGAKVISLYILPCLNVFYFWIKSKPQISTFSSPERRHSKQFSTPCPQSDWLLVLCPHPLAWATTAASLPLPLYFPWPSQSPTSWLGYFNSLWLFACSLTLQLQSITWCQTNLSSPFPSCNVSQDLTQSELPVSLQPSLSPFLVNLLPFSCSPTPSLTAPPKLGVGGGE